MERDRINSHFEALSNVFHDIVVFRLSTGEVRWGKQTYGKFFFFKERDRMRIPEDVDTWINTFIMEEERQTVIDFTRQVIEDVRNGIYGAAHMIEFSAFLPDRSTSRFVLTAWGEEPDDIFCCCAKLVRIQPMGEMAVKLRSEQERMEDFCRITKSCLLEWDVTNRCLHTFGAYEQYELSRYLNHYSWNSISVLLECVRHEDIPIIRSLIGQYRNGADRIEEVVQMKCVDGRCRWTRINIEIHSDEDGERDRMLWILTDIEDQMLHAEAPTFEKGLYIRTFGFFEVFLNGQPINFRHEKAKELFALLVDRRGGLVSAREAISVLWEEDEVNNVTLARHRKACMHLRRTLEEYGLSDVLEEVDHKRRINPDKVRCDLYDYLSGKSQYAEQFKGAYLLNYSWGEVTAAELSGKIWTI